MIIMRALLATALVTLACASEASAAPNARGNFGDCGTIDLEFTEGEIKAFGMSCKAAREVFRAWEAGQLPRQAMRATRSAASTAGSGAAT